MRLRNQLIVSSAFVSLVTFFRPWHPPPPCSTQQSIVSNLQERINFLYIFVEIIVHIGFSLVKCFIYDMKSILCRVLIFILVIDGSFGQVSTKSLFKVLLGPVKNGPFLVKDTKPSLLLRALS